MMKGLIHIYTGEGKGKTTASLGLAMRAKAHNLKVIWVSFHKDPEKYNCGEFKILKKIGVKTFIFAKECPYFSPKIDRVKLRNSCRKALQSIQKILENNKCDILILDEILISLKEKFIKEKEILKLFKSKPPNMEIVLTGRGATKKIIKEAHLVSYIKKIKHPYDKGIKPRQGIEF